MLLFFAIFLIYVVGVIVAYVCIFFFEYCNYNHIKDEYKRREMALNSVIDDGYSAIFSWITVVVILLLIICFYSLYFFRYVAKKLIRIGIKEKNKEDFH